MAGITHAAANTAFAVFPAEDLQVLYLTFGVAALVLVPWVLGRPGADDERLIREAIARALLSLPDILRGDLQRAMNALHSKL